MAALTDELMAEVLRDGNCRRSISRTLARPFDARCVLRDLATRVDIEDDEEAFRLLSEWAARVKAEIQVQMPPQSSAVGGGRRAQRAQEAPLILYVPRSWAAEHLGISA